MTKAELHARLDRIARAIEKIKFERNDRGPRLVPCKTEGCERFTRANFCLECENQRERKIQP